MWGWLRMRRHRGSDEARRAVHDAQERRQEAVDRWPEVRQEVDQLRAHKRRNSFAALFPEIGGKK
jgi:hypothetical protein